MALAGARMKPAAATAVASPDKSQTAGRKLALAVRRAGFQPAVSPNSIRQTVRRGSGSQIGNLRYSRLETCATSLRLKIAPGSL